MKKVNSKYLVLEVAAVIAVSIGLVVFTDNPVKSFLSDKSNSPHRVAQQTPDTDKTINLENELNKTAEIDVTVIRNETNQTVYNESYQADGRMEDIYNLQEA
jgi:hypothetical protein